MCGAEATSHTSRTSHYSAHILDFVCVSILHPCFLTSHFHSLTSLTSHSNLKEHKISEAKGKDVQDMVMMMETDGMVPPATLIRQSVAARMRAVIALAQSLGQPDPFRDNEADRLASIRATAMPPEACGPDAPLAPARGKVVPVTPWAMLPTADGYDLQHAGFRGRDAHRAADIFDRMQDQYARAGGKGALFTRAQLATARHYAALAERHAARGVRCISAEAMQRAGSGGGGGRDFADLLLAEAQRLARMTDAVGPGVAMAPRRSGRDRRAIPLRALVDQVCLQDRSIDQVLAAHGWSAWGDARRTLTSALAAALDRMAVVQGA